MNPNGNQTGYVFQYGLTNAYGVQSQEPQRGRPGRSRRRERGDQRDCRRGPSITIASSRSTGSALTTGADHTFKTTGPPPPGVVTGAPVSVGKTTATVTGRVSTNGAATTWLVQFGLTTAYGAQTFGQVVPNSPTPTAVSVRSRG